MGRNNYDVGSPRLTAVWEIDSARTMTLVAMVFQAIILAGALSAGPLLLIFGVWTSLPAWAQIVIVSSWPVLASFLILTYYLMYRKLTEETASEARVPGLVLGVLGLLAGGILPGVFLLIAYYKVAVAEAKFVQGGRPKKAAWGGRSTSRCPVIGQRCGS